jgi:hypothetical protein
MNIKFDQALCLGLGAYLEIGYPKSLVDHAEFPYVNASLGIYKPFSDTLIYCEYKGSCVAHVSFPF